ncbi:MAG: sigma factor [Patescibacteria group bacterium]
MKPGAKTDFENAVVGYVEMLYGVALRLTKDKAAAMKLAEETLLQAAAAFAEFVSQAQHSVKAWLLTMLRHNFRAAQTA